MKTSAKAKPFALLWAAVLVAQLSCAPPVPKAAKNSKLPMADRRVLKVCAPKRLLTRKDLEEIAKTYNPRRPAIGDIMRVNGDCGKTDQQETLDLGRCEGSAQCKTGIVNVPIN